jgi:nicotinate-nucleotide--dimethylbenzimidazole phosphoribosyltransferase
VTDLAALATDISWPDFDAIAKGHAAARTNPALGELGALLEWVAGAQSMFPPRPLERVRLLICAGDHAISAADVSGYTPGFTARTVAEINSGGGVVNVLAEQVNAGIRVVQCGATPGRIDVEDAFDLDAAAAALALGAVIADEEIDAGADLVIVGNLGAGSTTAAAAVIAVLTGTEPVKTVGRGGSGIDDDHWMHKVTAVRDARRRGWTHRSTPTQLLAAIGGADIAVMAGALARAAVRRTPVLLDGVVAAAAALLVCTEQPRAARWWRSAQLTGEPAQVLALDRMDVSSVLSLRMAVGDGTGGLLALSMIRAAIAAGAATGSADVRGDEGGLDDAGS